MMSEVIIQYDNFIILLELFIIVDRDKSSKTDEK